MRLTVPGNLLLLGEYAVTEEGGLGLALAVERRVVVELKPSASLVVEGRWGGTGIHWTRESVEASPLITATVNTWEQYLLQWGAGSSEREGPSSRHLLIPREVTAARTVPAARIVLDSSSFFSSGRKSGYGSSAAVTVALTCALLHLSGLRGLELIQWAARIALQAHRRTQKGRGSGYDVYASLYGGCGCVMGGTQPTWHAVRLPWLPRLYLFPGPASVSTPNSLSNYEHWKRANPQECRSFVEKSNQSVRSFVQADGWPQARRAFERSRELGLWLGQSIGVPATIEVSGSPLPALHKALGAGNELGIYLSDDPPQEADMEEVAVAPEGVRWHM
jgi:phosphomevalonate kinase